jgi:hypothetical protein
MLYNWLLRWGLTVAFRFAGWTYNYLDLVSTASALGIAENLYNNFLSHSSAGDDTVPKLLSIADMSKFSNFLSAFDSLSEELNREMLKDQNVRNIIKRAHIESIAFVGGTDPVDTAFPSSIDVGSFLDQFKLFCEPQGGSELDLRLQEAAALYASQFISRGVGPGAPIAATGMSIMFPRKEMMEKDNDLYQNLLDTSYHTSTKDLPRWLEFLENYYSSTFLGEMIDGSVCTKNHGNSAKSSLRGTQSWHG